MIPGNKSIDLLPNLPWHGFEKKDYKQKVFSGGKIVKITKDLYPTSWVFKEGHKIRLSIACSDWPTYELHPDLCPANHPDDDNNIIPVITVHHGPSTDSHIDLPLISKGTGEK